MNNVQVFSNSQFGEIRIAMNEKQEPLFCINDLCKALGIKNHRNVRARIDNDDVRQMDATDNLGRSQQTTFVTEAGMYDVILRSDAPTAKPFRKWVTSEVLPSIRKSGGYIVAKEDDSPEVIMARALQIANETIERSKQQLQIAQGTISQQEETIKTLAPKAAYTDDVLQSTSTYTLTQIAHDLGLRSIHTLTRLLSDKKIIYRQSGQWQPTAKVAGKGYFSTRTAKYVKSDGSVGTSMTTVVTETGRQYLHNLASRA